MAYRQSPYLTCSRCHSITFIDITRVRKSGHLDTPFAPSQYASLAVNDPITLQQSLASVTLDDTQLALVSENYEQIPKCPGCSSTKYLRIGTRSYEEEITHSQEKRNLYKIQSAIATKTLQRCVRGWLGRLEYRRRFSAYLNYISTKNNAATRIQSLARGIQGRRRVLIERCLLIIQKLHPSFLQAALRPRDNAPKVFWYTNKSELAIFFFNYRQYVRRTGYQPSLLAVENNVLEITQRMLQHEHTVISRIQALWRGITARIAYISLRHEKSWLKGRQQAPAIRIQRLYRMHVGQKRCKVLQANLRFLDQIKAYHLENNTRIRKITQKELCEALMVKYRREYQYDKTIQMMALQPDIRPTYSSVINQYITHETDQNISVLEQFDNQKNNRNRRRSSAFLDLQKQIQYKKMQRKRSSPRIHVTNE